MQMRAARYVIQVVILILRYCDRLRNLERIGQTLTSAEFGEMMIRTRMEQGSRPESTQQKPPETHNDAPLLTTLRWGARDLG
jgi:hypothetical protein